MLLDGEIGGVTLNMWFVVEKLIEASNNIVAHFFHASVSLVDKIPQFDFEWGGGMKNWSTAIL